MQDGAAILSADGDVAYCSHSFAALVATPLQEVIGGSATRYFDGDSRMAVDSLLGVAAAASAVRAPSAGMGVRRMCCCL